MHIPRPLTTGALLALVLLPSLPCGANGGEYKLLRLKAAIRLDDQGSCEFESELDPILFALTSVHGKYQVLRIRIVNHSDHPLLLDEKKDRVELIFAGRTVPAILDLHSRDPHLWNALPADLRRVLAYPHSVAALEEASAFAFIPAEASGDAPTRVFYTLASLPQKAILLLGPQVMRSS